MASPQTIQPSSKDAKLYELQPTINSGTTANIYVSSNTSARYRSLMSFDFSAVVPAGATITLATLSLNCLTSAASRTITVYRLLHTDWVENQATWNIYKTGSNWGTAGALGLLEDFTTTDAATATSVAVGQWLNETVTAQVQTALDYISGVAHFLIADVGGSVSGFNSYASLQNATTTNRPKLYIEYTEPSSAPNLKINVGGTWKEIVNMSINIGGVWKVVESAKVNVGGIWKNA